MKKRLTKEYTGEYTGHKYQELFSHMIQQHNVILLKSEMDEIINIVKKTQIIKEMMILRNRKVRLEFAMYIKEHAEEFDCKLISMKGLNEDECLISISGELEDLKAINNEAKRASPLSSRSTNTN